VSGATDIVSCDIGGTHARFALATIHGDGKIDLTEPVTLATGDYATLNDAWQAFAESVGDALPRDASLALAAPIVGDHIPLTNSPWSIRRSELGAELGIERYTLLNDFAAIGHAVASAPNDLFKHLSGPEIDLPVEGAITIVGPGTGLGVALVWRDGKGGYHVQATEGGHVEFAPVDAIDDALVALLRPKYGRVVAERVVAGPGIVAIHQALAEREGCWVPQLEDRALWQMGTSGEDSLAAAAVERFCLSLGSLAGDYALAHGSQAVVIAGGLGYRIREQLHGSGFAERFCDKEPYQRLMKAMPVKLITHPQPGLYGAAAAFAREHLG
jgi:glucokinase